MPDTATVSLYRDEGQKILAEGELTLPDVLPEFRVEVGRLFR